MKKWIGNLLILTGAALLIWLWSGSNQVQKNQDQLIEAFAAVKDSGETGELRIVSDDESVKGKAKSTLPSNIEGVLSIPSIQLKSPVIAGASGENLNQSLASISGMDKPGVLNGSYAIAGHQSHVFGEFFNRLNELQVGEHFSYETMTETLTFEVFDIQIVKPSEVDSLNSQKGMALLSLITCYPERSNKYRLIVHSKRID